MRFRPCTKEDLDTIYLLECTSFIKSRWTKDHLDYEFFENPCAYLYVLEEGRVFAYIDIWLLYEKGEICKIAVAEPLRKKGAGYFLLSETLKIMEESGVETINLEVDVNNIAAINLYKKCGFEIVNIKKNYYGENIDAYQMMKKGEKHV